MQGHGSRVKKTTSNRLILTGEVGADRPEPLTLFGFRTGRSGRIRAKKNMELRLPELSEDTKDVIITEWYVSENDRIAEGQDILEVATDKATFEVPSPCDGIISRIIKRKGDNVTADVVIAEIQAEGWNR